MRDGLVALSILLFATGCSSDGQHAVSEGDHTIYVHDSSLIPRGGLTAEIVGELAVREGCVVVGSEETGLWYPVVWPSGTRIASVDPFAVRLPSGIDVTEGETVVGGGGFLSPTRVDVRIPERCLPESREVAVFNPNDDTSKS